MERDRPEPAPGNREREHESETDAVLTGAEDESRIVMIGVDEFLASLDLGDIDPAEVTDEQLEQWLEQSESGSRLAVGRAIVAGKVLVHLKTFDKGRYRTFAEKIVKRKKRTVRVYTKLIADLEINGNVLPLNLDHVSLRGLTDALGQIRKRKPDSGDDEESGDEDVDDDGLEAVQAALDVLREALQGRENPERRLTVFVESLAEAAGFAIEQRPGALVIILDNDTKNESDRGDGEEAAVPERRPERPGRPGGRRPRNR